MDTMHEDINAFDWLDMEPWMGQDGKWRLASWQGRGDSIVGIHDTLTSLHEAMMSDWRAKYDIAKRAGFYT